jgi:aminomethyltransferase
VPAGDIPSGTGGEVRVDIRGKHVPVRVVKFPFVRDGKPMDGI